MGVVSSRCKSITLSLLVIFKLSFCAGLHLVKPEKALMSVRFQMVEVALLFLKHRLPTIFAPYAPAVGPMLGFSLTEGLYGFGYVLRQHTCVPEAMRHNILFDSLA